MPFLGIFDQKYYIWVFLGYNLKRSIAIFEIRPLNLSKNASLTYTVNFGIGSSFSKVPGSTFPEDLGPGPDPLYKVCQKFP